MHKYQSDYSEAAAALIGQIKANMMDGMDAYFRATQSVYEWSGLAIKLLNTYSFFFRDKMDQEKFDAARSLLLLVLEDGIEKMRIGQSELGDSSASFNAAAGQLTQLNNRLAIDFNESGEFYLSKIAQIRRVAYGAAAPFRLFGVVIAATVAEAKLIPDVKDKMAEIAEWFNDVSAEVQNSFKNIDDTKAELKEEIRRIGEIKIQAKETKSYVEIDYVAQMKETIMESVADLIAKCKDYRFRHIDIK